MNTLQTDIAAELQKSLMHMKRFGQEMETLDDRFGRLRQRIEAARSTLGGLNVQLNPATGRVVQESAALQSTLPLTLQQGSQRELFRRAEAELNRELQRFVRNLSIELDPSYAGGQRLDIGNEGIGAINDELASVIRQQIDALAGDISEAGRAGASIPGGWQQEMGQSTARALAKTIKSAVINNLANPKILEPGEIAISPGELTHTLGTLKDKLLQGLAADLPDAAGSAGNTRLRQVYSDIDKRFAVYANQTAAGINEIMSGKIELPVSELTGKLKSSVEKEFSSSMNIPVHDGMADDWNPLQLLTNQLQQIGRPLAKQMNAGMDQEADDLIKEFNEGQAMPFPKLKGHLMKQMDRINSRLLEKIREQADAQLSAIIQEINELQAQAGRLDRKADIEEAGKGEESVTAAAGGGGSGSGSGDAGGGSASSGGSQSTSSKQPEEGGGDSGSKKDGKFSLGGAVLHSVRKLISGTISELPMTLFNEAVETFKAIQPEQLKMTQNLMFKPEYRTKDAGGGNVADMFKVNAAVKALQGFIGQQSVYYGQDYSELYKVGTIGSQSLSDPVEIKKFIQLTAQLKTLDTGGSTMKIAAGLESVRSQFGLEMADMQKQVAEPLAAAVKASGASVEKLLAGVQRSAAVAGNPLMKSSTAIVMAGAAAKATDVKGADDGSLYKGMLEKLQSAEALSELQKLGINPYNSDSLTGNEIVKPGEELLKSLAEALEGKSDQAKHTAYDTVFGTPLASKTSAAMHELMNNFVEVNGAVKQFADDAGSKPYRDLIQKSLDNPLVNTNRAKESVTVALDALLQELTPAINQVSYGLIHMANFVEKNADTFAKLGGVLSNVIIGLMMMQGIKWGAGKIGGGVLQNAAAEKQRTGFLGYLQELNGTHQIGANLRGMTRGEVERMQQNPLLERYISEMHNMSDVQKEHLKSYISAKGIGVNDAQTLFTVMDEAKNWTRPEELNDDQKYERHRQYNHRISAQPELAGALNASFLHQMERDASGRGRWDSSRNNTDYADASNRLTGMTQDEFHGFESHLAQRRLNGLPAIDSYASLGTALQEYQTRQSQAEMAARQSTGTFGDLSHAVRGMNAEISRSQKLKNGFKQFLKDIPDLGRGALSSIKSLGAGIAAMGLQIAASIVLAQAGKAVLENYTATESDRKLTKADTLDKNADAFANTLRIDGDQNLLKSFGNTLYATYGSMMNGISRFFGGSATHYGAGNMNDMYTEMMADYNFSGSQYQFAEYLKNKGKAEGKTSEDYVREWYAQSDSGKESQQLRQEAATLQYEQAQLDQAEEDHLQKIAKENYAKKYTDGTLQYSAINADSVNERIQDKLSDIKDQNSMETLRALTGGMRTDSEAYIAMRKEQVSRMRKVLTDELAMIDTYIENAKAVMNTHDVNSEEYKEAQRTVDGLTETRKDIADKGEADILQEELNQQQEAYQKRLTSVNRNVQKIDLLAQAKELAAAYNMDNSSQAYLDIMKKISLGKLDSMKAELENMKNIQADGEKAEELAMNVLQLQNSISTEEAKVKELNLASIGIGRQKIEEHNSERDNDLLALQVQAGNPDESSPILRNQRIANYKAEITEIAGVISNLKSRLTSSLTEDETVKINAEIRDLQKQSLQAQLGILDEVKTSSGTFNLPAGVTAMSRYEYLSAQGTHQSTTVGMGDVTVNITLPNVTNGATQSELQTIGQGLGQGLAQGRLGGVRQQLGGNPVTAYRSHYGR
ncbi:phage tail tape measure protein [Paenibacillus tengchongensis]|uniref:phage tail tape measure protein n=1 Tax=Paenibacillus tengchongensis TaxID=2608684 RepID=UPI00124F05E4|nr:phage tail tape measure protein [Paenibacillus tengchongensis]